MDESNNVNMGGDPKGGSSGPIIAIIVILVIIILGGLYFWNQNKAGTNLESGNSANLESINTQSSSDNTADIEADLNATDVDNLDAELDAS